MALTDAKALAVENNSFSVPGDDELKKVKKGDFIKVCQNGERFWIEVESNDTQALKFKGTVANNLVNNSLDLGAEMEAEYRHIYDYIIADVVESILSHRN